MKKKKVIETQPHLYHKNAHHYQQGRGSVVLGAAFLSFELRFESQWEWGLESLLLSCFWVLPMRYTCHPRGALPAH